MRIVVDTNVLVSFALFPLSVPGRSYLKAFHSGTLLSFKSSLAELEHVLSRQKFDRYLSLEERATFYTTFTRASQSVVISQRVAVCRDRKDDMILELALNGMANLIVSGDRDLLLLGSFEGIEIRTPASYLALE